MSTHREERKRFYVEGGQYFLETTIYCLDTQTVDRAWVREVSRDEVPAALLAEEEPAIEQKLGLGDDDYVGTVTEVKPLPEEPKGKKKR
jgi:hypothetical protein